MGEASLGEFPVVEDPYGDQADYSFCTISLRTTYLSPNHSCMKSIVNSLFAVD